MAHLNMCEREQLAVEAQQILDEIESTLGRVPNLFRTYAAHPPLLRANWGKMKAAMMEGELPRRLKEAIALLVSQDNGCRYCVAAHSAALQRLGVDDDTLAAIREGRLADADFDARDRALIDLMRTANARPHEVTGAQFDAVRAAGASETDILEAYAVMETFIAFNRFLDSVDVELGQALVEHAGSAEPGR